MQVEAQVQIDHSVTLKLAAELVARSLMGEGTLFFDPSAGQNYEGTILAVQHGFAIQKIGRYGALHDLGRLAESPKVGHLVDISYPRDGTRPNLIDLTAKSQDVGPDIGR
jgi:hypothetical protein